MSQWRDRIFHLFDLPSDVTSSNPRLEWIKNSHLQIENHQGIQYFSSGELRVQVKDQFLSVTGSNLKIKVVNAYHVILTGEIEQIRYI